MGDKKNIETINVCIEKIKKKGKECFFRRPCNVYIKRKNDSVQKIPYLEI